MINTFQIISRALHCYENGRHVYNTLYKQGKNIEAYQFLLDNYLDIGICNWLLHKSCLKKIKQELWDIIERNKMPNSYYWGTRPRIFNSPIDNDVALTTRICILRKEYNLLLPTQSKCTLFKEEIWKFFN